MRSFKVSSSNGYLIVDSDTGIIIQCFGSRRKHDYLPDIIRFDVDRFKVCNNCNTIPEDVDILRFAYWSKNNIYDTPAEGYEPISSDEEFFNKMYSSEDIWI